jgi:outer membrane biosynthesis protein TonB
LFYDRNEIPPMRCLITVMVVAVFAAVPAFAQEAEPTPGPSPSPSPAEKMESPAPSPSPAAEASPEPSSSPSPQMPPELLPESKTLPPQPPQSQQVPGAPELRDLIPEGTLPQLPTTPTKPLASQQEQDKVRFRQLRTIAARNPYAIYLWEYAKWAKTEQSRREIRRLYYQSMCAEMRRMEPRLKGMIDSFELAAVSRSDQTRVQPTIPVRDLPRWEAQRKRQSD